MAYQTLYRKYRPKTFELVFGQDVIIKTLKNIIKNNKISHAYLFTGPRGTGKTSSAKLFAKAINCLNSKDGDSCNECKNCISFNENSNPDIIEIDAASNNGVDEIRELKSKVGLVPSMSKYKVYIIDEVHMLSIGAFNALLKTLEEPPEYVIFILATTEPQKIPATIISRCQRFDFKSISHDKMKECLKEITIKENITIEEKALEEIISNSKGGMRDAISLLDQASSFCNNNIRYEDIEELSGNISDEQLRIFIKKIINKNYIETFSDISDFLSKGKDFTLICEKIINYITKGILYKKKIKTDIFSEDENIYEILTDSQLYKIIDFLSETLVKINNSYQKELVFEVQIIQLIDMLSDKKNNVSRETLKLENNNSNNKANLKKEEIDVSRETSNEKEKIINELKNIRINNILKYATRKDIDFINELWKNINDYLINSKYKISAGILIQAKPVAASNKGLIISIPLESGLKRIEKEYDTSKELIKEIYNYEYKIVYISEQHWKEIRPKFIEKIKTGKIEFINEKECLENLKKIENKNSMQEFNDLIEMEDF